MRWQIHRERTHFPNPQQQIARPSPACEGEIAYGAMALKLAALVGHRAPDRNAAVGTNREGHRGLAGRPILGGMQIRRKGRARPLRTPWSSLTCAINGQTTRSGIKRCLRLGTRWWLLNAIAHARPRPALLEHSSAMARTGGDEDRWKGGSGYLIEGIPRVRITRSHPCQLMC